MSRVKAFEYTLDPEQIPTAKVVDVTHESGLEVVLYACPDSCWAEHLNAWRRQRRAGNTAAPQPMPYGHCMFIPSQTVKCYAKVPYGCTDLAVRRQAIEVHVRAQLHGWDQDLKQTKEGREQLERIIAATTDAKMGNQPTGAVPFLACLTAGFDLGGEA